LTGIEQNQGNTVISKDLKALSCNLFSQTPSNQKNPQTLTGIEQKQGNHPKDLKALRRIVQVWVCVVVEIRKYRKYQILALILHTRSTKQLSSRRLSFVWIGCCQFLS